MRQKKVSESQIILTTGTTARSVESRQNLEQQIANLKISIEVAKQLLEEGEEGKSTRMLWALTIERYGSARLPEVDWWLSPDDMEEEEDSDKPRAEDYKWGSYWRGHDADAERFVGDRAEWILPSLEEELKEFEATLAEYADIKPFVDSPEIGATPSKRAEKKRWGKRHPIETTMEKWTSSRKP